VRVDTHMYTGYTIPSYYDSLIAKLIVWAPSREDAIIKANRALNEFKVGGVKTTIAVHKKILSNEDFTKGDMDTGLLERIFKDEKSKK